MKFTCQQKEFLQALNIVQKAVGGVGVLPILENILISAEGQSVELSATNLEISITTSFSADIQNEGRITIPARTILSWMSLVSGDKIELTRTEGEGVTLKTKGSKTTLKGLSAEEFPALPVVEKEECITVTQVDFKRAIEGVVFSAATTGTRPVLSGVLLYNDGKNMVVVGTDSYRLSEKRIPFLKNPKEAIRCIIPAKTLMEVERILSPEKKEDGIEIIISKNQILFLVDNIRIISRLIEGQFPNYQQILPKGHKNNIEVDRHELIQVVKRVGIFARENNNNIKLSLSDKEMKITTDVTEIGVDESVIPIENPNGENIVALNSQFLLDILLVFNGKKVNLHLGEKLSPISIVSPQEEDFLHIIMPLKV